MKKAPSPFHRMLEKGFKRNSLEAPNFIFTGES
jgi:hypothetical protein